MKPIFLLAGLAFLFSTCNNSNSSSSAKDSTIAKTDSSMKESATSSSLKEENVTYSDNGVTMNGYLVYDANKQGKRPGVIVVHEWWGLNDYPKMRARKLAELGYVAFALDMYGNGKTVDNPTDAGKISGPFYQDLKMTKSRFDAALNKLKTYSEVDTSNIAAIGYCFGGGVVLNVARLGDDLKGVVSFHGSLMNVPVNKNLKTKFLVCHGAADQFVKQQDVAQFKKEMDSINADYTFKQYPNAMHAFTNPAATETGERFKIPIKYDAQADSASWNDMKDFFGKLFR